MAPSVLDKRLTYCQSPSFCRPLTIPAIQQYDRRVDVYAVLLEKRIGCLSAKHEPIDVVKWFHWFSIDVMMDLTFSKSFRMLETGLAHPITKMLHDSLEIVGLLSPVPWLIRIGLDLLPRCPVVKQWRDLVTTSRQLMGERKEVLRKSHQILPQLTWLFKRTLDLRDISYWLINQANKDSCNQENQRWLYGDSTSAIIAGR